MKKTLTSLIVGAAALSLAACDSPKTDEVIEEAAPEVVAEDATMAEDAMMVEEAPEAADEEGEVPLGGTGNPIGPAASDAEE